MDIISKLSEDQKTQIVEHLKAACLLIAPVLPPGVSACMLDAGPANVFIVDSRDKDLIRRMLLEMDK